MGQTDRKTDRSIALDAGGWISCRRLGLQLAKDRSHRRMQLN